MHGRSRASSRTHKHDQLPPLTNAKAHDGAEEAKVVLVVRELVEGYAFWALVERKRLLGMDCTTFYPPFMMGNEEQEVDDVHLATVQYKHVQHVNNGCHAISAL